MGARCDELCGAMVADVRVVDGVNVLRIDAVNREKGGSVKHRVSVRTVPLHPAIIREGFLAYVATLPNGGALFPMITPDRFGKVVATGKRRSDIGCAKKLKVVDKLNQPNHAWR